MKILYFGNRSGQRGKYPTVQDELTPLFQQNYEVVSVSDKSGYVQKIVDMLRTFILHIRKTDVVLIDTFSTSNFYFAWGIGQLCRLVNKPYINFLHGGSLPERLKNNPRLSAMVFHHAFALVAPSKYMQVNFDRYGYAAEMIPNMLHLDRYEYKARSFKEAKLFWLRSFRKHYNPLMAVEVLKLLLDQGIPASLVMVGPDSEDGSLGEVKDYVAKHNIDKFVTFSGLLAKEAWKKESEHANILINTTNIDNTPISVIECMALGLAIVSTNVGGLPYLLDDGVDAHLVPKGDSHAMADAIIKLISQEDESLRLTHQARKKVEYFDWETVKHKWQQLLERASKA